VAKRSGLAAPERNIDPRPASLLNHYPAGTLSVQRRTGGRDRRVTQQLGCHLDRHTAVQQLGRPGVPKSICGPNMIPVCSRSRQILPLMPSMSPLEMPRSIALMTPLEIDRDLWVMS
jgi:hypothetical protein